MSDYRFVFSQHGDADVLVPEPVDTARQPGAGEVRLRHAAIGVNFIDVYFRTGVNPVTALPSPIGLEGVGIVEAVGEGVDFVRVGDRMGYGTGHLGAYSTVRVMSADALIPVPDWVESDVAAAALTKGMTAEMLVNQCSRIQPGQTALVHAAAGGVGSLLVQWLKAIGVTVIAHAGSETKAERARQLGADVALSCPYSELAAEVRRVTDGKRAHVVFESVGADSWEASLGSVARTGLIASFGNASGRPPAFTTKLLADAGSIFVTRPNTFHYNYNRERRWAAAAAMFDMVRTGKLKIDIGQRFALRDAAAAHRALESRKTTGSTILVPES
jgi:NADPH2:quinone reductase